jgi:excisionase family DNA binding protein
MSQKNNRTIMDDAPLFAGLDDFVIRRVEAVKTAPPEKEKKKSAPRTTKPAEAAVTPKIQKKTEPPDPDAILLSVAEMCRLLKISRATLVRMDNTGKLPGRIKLGGSVRFHRATVEAWLQSLIAARPLL